MKPSLGAFAAFITALLYSASASAGETDGAYGRFQSDMSLELDLGAIRHAGETGMHSALVLRYLQTAGLYVSFSDPLRNSESPLSKQTSLGVELRPLFLPRFLKNRESGPSSVDLTIDSIALRAGAILSAAPYAEPKRPGYELALGMGLPLSGRAQGPWLSCYSGLRFTGQALEGNSRLADTAFISIFLGWQGFIDMGIVDIADRRLR